MIDIIKPVKLNELKHSDEILRITCPKAVYVKLVRESHPPHVIADLNPFL